MAQPVGGPSSRRLHADIAGRDVKALMTPEKLRSDSITSTQTRHRRSYSDGGRLDAESAEGSPSKAVADYTYAEFEKESRHFVLAENAVALIEESRSARFEEDLIVPPDEPVWVNSYFWPYPVIATVPKQAETRSASTLEGFGSTSASASDISFTQSQDESSKSTPLQSEMNSDTDSQASMVMINALPSSSPDTIMSGLLRSMEEGGCIPPSMRAMVGPDDDVPQELLPMPDDPRRNEPSMKLRGTEVWAPPRFQLIFNVHHKPKRSQALVSQSNRCKSCGMLATPVTFKTFRYCDYLGKYFCASCHSMQTAVIPARVLRYWDFAPRPVCEFSHQLLARMFGEPVYNVANVNAGLYVQAKELNNARELRSQLLRCKPYLVSCSRADPSLIAALDYRAQSDGDLDLYSMRDLVSIKSGQYVKDMRDLIARCEAHILKCVVCRELGYVCEVCKSKELLYPFQSAAIHKCEKCKNLYHAACFKKIAQTCPKCARLERRRREVEKNELSTRVDNAAIAIAPSSPITISGGPTISSRGRTPRKEQQ
eukprot:m.38213 g.38213  ORF g.38213 m.38213 type:complete len:541 (+) comp5490_c0_seq3:95-1717(+)